MATIAYRGRAGDTQQEVDDLRFDERTGHWTFPVEETEDGDTVLRSVPRERVYYVERAEESVGVSSGDTTSPP